METIIKHFRHLGNSAATTDTPTFKDKGNTANTPFCSYEHPNNLTDF